ncbi:hypothetical protein K469DRAFT_804954 [Zopfia rhizophila CBS 207.26]|uniref:Uncharacterized protein n=1 Tax=Zopfia rhizophila CBS 207.26 TaxID=1314779 RepID=A0A6A6EMA5_9PEZI|nr:hypothetical protein K469DRAFT_804954 [Zopfia rhizophila CBS 207.26]
MKIVALLLKRGASASGLSKEADSSSLLHAAVASGIREILQIVIDTSAAEYITLKDALKQTPLHLAAQSYNSEILEILRPILAVESVNDEDIDGRTPLHHAVESQAFEAIRWLINRGARADVPDFTSVTAFQLALQKRNFRILSLLFPQSIFCLHSLTASDWRSALPNHLSRNILLTDGESASIKIMGDEELVRHLEGMSYSLSPSVSKLLTRHGTKSVAEKPERYIVILENSKLIGDHLSAGVYWRWWRKMMEKPERRFDQTHRNWVWKAQLEAIPPATAIKQAPVGECFLECRIILPSCTLTKPRVQGTALKARETQHGVIWIMAKPANLNAAMETVLESKAFFSTLEYSAIPRWPTDLFLPLVRQLRVEWAHSYEVAERRLSEMRTESFRSSGKDPNLIKILLTDAELWTYLSQVLKRQIDSLLALHKHYENNWTVLKEGNTQYHSDSVETPESKRFRGEIESLNIDVSKELGNLTRISQNLIQLFIFLPLMFISSLFGMNINLLKSDPPWWLYILFATGTTIVTIALEDRLEQKFAWLLRRRIVQDEEKGPLQKRQENQIRTLQFSAFGKKRS